MGYFGGLRGGPRGNATKLILNYCGVTYTDKFWPIGDGQTEWKAFKATTDIPWADMPYLTDGDVKISQTLAIQYYVAAKWKPELLGASP